MDPVGPLRQRVVQLARAVVAPADQRLDLAGVRIHGHQRYLRIRPRRHRGFKLILPDLGLVGAHLGDLLVHQLHSSFHRLRSRALKVGIECRIDAVFLVVHLALVQLADNRVAHHIHEIRRVTRFHVGRSQFKRHGLALSACSRVIAPVSTMDSITVLRRSKARSGWRYGER